MLNIETKMHTKAAVLLACLCALTSNPARGQTTTLGSAFTYQGVLNQSGKPATGLYDFRARLASSASGGDSATIMIPSQIVTNGLFTLSIDFGATAFNGQALYLELDVTTNGASDYAVLQPFQIVSPVPYAIYAQSAATALSATAVVSNSISAAQLSTAAPPQPGQVLTWNGSALVWGNPATGTNSAIQGSTFGASVTSYGAKGDGSDDTLAVATCVAANNWVYFPPSNSNLYVVDYLLVHSNTRITVAPGVTIKMANRQDHAFVTNNWSGTVNVIIEGGIWDANWQNQSYGPNLSQVFNLEYITNLVVRDLTIQQTATKAINGNAFRCARWRNLKFENINLQMLSGDGIHLNGPGDGALITGTYGVTSDSFIAINAADWILLYPQYDSMGPISNVKIENTRFESGPQLASTFSTPLGQDIRIEPGLAAGVTNVLVDGLHGENYRGLGVLMGGPVPAYGDTNGFADNIHVTHVDAWLLGPAFTASFDMNSSFGHIYLDHIYSPHALNNAGLIEFSDGNYSDVYISDCSVSSTNGLSTFPMISVFGSGISTNFNTAIVTNLNLANLHMDGHVIVGNHVQGTAQRIIAQNLQMDNGANAIFNTGSSFIWAQNIAGNYSAAVLLLAGAGTNRIVAGNFPTNSASMTLSGVTSVVSADNSVAVDGKTITPLPGDRFYNTNSAYASGIGWYTIGGNYGLATPPQATASTAATVPGSDTQAEQMRGLLRQIHPRNAAELGVRPSTH